MGKVTFIEQSDDDEKTNKSMIIKLMDEKSKDPTLDRFQRTKLGNIKVYDSIKPNSIYELRWNGHEWLVWELERH